MRYIAISVFIYIQHAYPLCVLYFFYFFIHQLYILQDVDWKELIHLYIFLKIQKKIQDVYVLYYKTTQYKNMSYICEQHKNKKNMFALKIKKYRRLVFFLLMLLALLFFIFAFDTKIFLEWFKMNFYFRNVKKMTPGIRIAVVS